MEDWAEVHRLFHREGLPKAVIARRSGMSRNTVDRLLRLTEPPRYVRARQGSQLDPFLEAIAAMLAADPSVRATVIRERLRAEGYGGGLTILKDHLARVRPGFRAARAFQRTSYRPGEIGQIDWCTRVPGCRWATGNSARPSGWWPRCPGRAPTRRSSPWAGRWATCALRWPAASNAWVACPRRSSSTTTPRSWRPASPGRPTSKGHAERTIGYLETSFLPLRGFDSLEDLQGQHDAWAVEVAFARRLRRTGTTVAGGWAVERGHLAGLPRPMHDTDLRLEARAVKGFVRVLTADYSVPPAYADRRLAIRVTPSAVHLACEGLEVAAHRRSFVPADVVLDPAHGRAGRLAREARDRLARGDVELPEIDLARYDALAGVGS